ncbi:hypothetical protein CDAR_315731 [Caerostris darwini]|uniref:Uncharacterized protein n=1 Tax=Caerostris darwini TaxID=1538125 RepID=A0AAV4PU76_9ARAC|nr:hypothetical protein CDAR_315731 [Caerostris darwini]
MKLVLQERGCPPSSSTPIYHFECSKDEWEFVLHLPPTPFRFGTSILSRRQTKTKGIDERKDNRHPLLPTAPPPCSGVVEHGKFRKLLRSVNTSFH